MQIRGPGDTQLHSSRNRLQVPIAVGGRIAFHGDQAGDGMCFDVIRSALDFDFATRVGGLDTCAGLSNADNAGNSIGNHVAFDARCAYVTRSGRNMKFASNIVCRDGPACSGEVGIALDFFKADGTRGGVHGYGSSYISNDLGAGSHGGADFGIVRNLNVVGDRDVAQIREFFSDADGRAPLLDGWIRDGIVEALPRVVKAKSRGAHIGVNVHLAVGAAGDVHVAKGIAQFQTDRTGHRVIAIEGAARGR